MGDAKRRMKYRSFILLAFASACAHSATAPSKEPPVTALGPAWDSTTYSVGVTAKGFVSSVDATLLRGAWTVVITTSYGGQPDQHLIVNGADMVVLKAGAGPPSYVLSATLHHCWPWHPTRVEGDGSPPICTDTATVGRADANVIDSR